MASKSWHDPDTLERLYWEEEMSLKEIGEELGCAFQTVHRWMDKHDIPTRKTTHEKPPMFRMKGGYEVWRTEVKGTNHSIMVHRLLGVAEYGFEGVVDKDIHHKNGIPWDNRHENIEPVTPEQHTEIHYPHQDKDHLRTLIYGEGLTISEIAKKFDVREESISDCLTEYGFSTGEDTVHGIEDEWKRHDTLHTHFHEGEMSVAEIAQKYNVTQSEIKTWLDENGIEWRERELPDYHKEDVLREMYLEEELSQTEIADHFNVTQVTIHTKLKEHGIKREYGEMMNGDRPWQDREKMTHLYHDQEKSMRQIARIFDCSRSTVSHWLDKHEIEKRPSPQEIHS